MDGLITLLVPVITGIFALAAILLKEHKARKKSQNELEQAKAELSFSRTAMDFGAFMEEWEETYEEMNNLMATTNVDRILISRAWNGKADPKWTTAVFQMRQGKQEPISYVHFELDEDYVNRLREITIRNTSYWVVDEMPESYLKDIYDTEGVKATMWAILDEKDGSNGSKAITYCSFATHNAELMDTPTITKCKIVVGRLKGIAANFYKK